MSHSHIAVQHLLSQLEERRNRRRQRDERPVWLATLIEEAAELFEPLTGVARVGYDCVRQERAWVVRLYLGRTELVGGASDGLIHPVSFEFDLQRLLARFDRVDEFFWSVFTDDCSPDEASQACVTIAGEVCAAPVELRLLATAPPEVGPGLRLFPNGDVQTT